MIGQTVSHYKILEELGRGGMGVVYRARDTRLDRDVALKFLANGLIRDDRFRDRLLQEARAAASLTHTNICTLYDVSESDERLFLIMEYVDGRSLRQVLAEDPMAPETAASYALQIAQGLERAHETGIVHRDIKPENVMINSRGEVKILDFGIAKLSGAVVLTKNGTTLGTPAYMSPEQARAEEVTAKTDMWSLGVILFEMLVGEYPFQGDYDAALAYSIKNVDPEVPVSVRESVPASIISCLEDLLSKDPNARPDAAEVTSRLSDSSIDESQSTVSVPRWAWALATVAVTAALLVFVLPGLLRADIRTSENDLTIAIIPFDDYSLGEENQYLGDVMADELFLTVSKIENIRVASINAARYVKSQTADPLEMGVRLGVRYVLLGSTRISGDSLRFIYEVTDTETGFSVMSAGLDLKIEEFWSVQNRVASDIAAAIHSDFTPLDITKYGGANGTHSLEAYNLLLRARAEHLVDLSSLASYHSAIQLVDQALALDSTYANAYEEKVRLIYTTMEYGVLPPTPVLREEVRRLSLLAQVNAPNSRVAYYSLSQVELMEFNFKQAFDFMQLCLESRPGGDDCLDMRILINLGHVADVLDQVHHQIATSRYALDYRMITNQAWYLINLGDLESATEIVLNGIGLNPDGPLINLRHAELLAKRGDYVGALEILGRLTTGPGSRSVIFQSYRGIFLAMNGRMDEARVVLRTLQELSLMQYVPETGLAAVHAALGDFDIAFEQLNRALDNHEPWMSMLNLAPFTNQFREDPRWGLLMNRILPDNPWKRARYDENLVLLNPNFINQTKQIEKRPPPPRPPVPVAVPVVVPVAVPVVIPVVVPDDVILDDDDLNFDSIQDLDVAFAERPSPPAAVQESEETEPEIFEIVEDPPTMVGGITALNSTIKYPEIAIRAGLEGTVVVRIIINEYGEPSDPTIEKSVHKALDNEAKRAVMLQSFIPGKQRGNPVKVLMSIRVNFRLN